MKLTEEIAKKIYAVLVEFGGADGREYEIQNFVYNMTHDDIHEWRFQGHFGFGGKYWSDTNRISCYTEDETPDRLNKIKIVNDELKKIIQSNN